MSAIVECPECGSENAYHNGYGYECPDCGEIWDDGFDDYDED